MFNEDEEKRPPSSVLELKNAIDWASRPYGDSAWSGKSAAIMGASLGAIGTARAQYHLRQIFVALNLFTLNQPEVIIADAAHRFDENGNLIHEPTKQLIPGAAKEFGGLDPPKFACTGKYLSIQHGNCAASASPRRARLIPAGVRACCARSREK